MITTHDELVELIVDGARYPLRHGVLIREYERDQLVDWSMDASALHGVPLTAGEHDLTIAIAGERFTTHGLLVDGGSLTSHRWVRGRDDLQPAD